MFSASLNFRLRLFLSFLFLFTLIFPFSLSSIYAQSEATGKIAGTLVDAETGNPLIGANVFLENTTMGAASDLDGNYIILNVPVRSYTLIVNNVGYVDTKITNVEVKKNDVVKIDVAVKSEIMVSETITVEAKALKNTEASLLKDRQKAIAVSDAVSAEAMANSGSNNAAEAMTHVTGASVVDGKYIFIRGLGDRYTSTNLNGAEIPSTNPYKRAAAIDLIPTNLIDNIVTTKSFTPDKPGNFSGGAVDIHTKDFPDKFNLTLTTGVSYNSQTTFKNDGPIGYTGGGKDWLGMDDGTRDIPEALQSGDVFIPQDQVARNSPDAALELDRLVKSFNPQMTPVPVAPGINHNYSISLGNQFIVFGQPFGILGSFSYRQDHYSYVGGRLKRWSLRSAADDFLVNDFDFTDTKSNDEVLWGALINASYKITSKHVISFNGMYNQNGESVARYLEGSYPYDLDEDEIFQTSFMGYNERNLKSLQLRGKHLLDFLADIRISWRGSVGTTKQDEPDLRYVTSFVNPKGISGIKLNVPPERYYRFLSENRRDFAIDIAVPFKQWAGLQSTIKFGAFASEKKRDYAERLFRYGQNPEFNFNGDMNEFFGPNNLGFLGIDSLVIGETAHYFNNIGLSLREVFLPANNYRGDENISAYYAMFDLPLYSRLRFIVGFRYEKTDIYVETQDKDLGIGDLDTEDFLPSVNFIYAFTENMNLRASYTKTLARPLFRELAPYASFDFVGGDTYIGNPYLKRTLIENIDFRWEWFSRSGEIYAVSAFYKNFHDPIEMAILNVNHEIKWKNVHGATAVGLELEVRKKLDIIHESLKNWLIGGNLSIVDSEVDITESELELIRLTRPDAPEKREFAGQSPYLFNFNLTYDDPESGIVSSIYFNRFGERLSIVSLGGTPDVYEKPFNTLNFSFKWQFTTNFSFNFGASNILNDSREMSQTYKDKEYVYSAFSRGRQISFGIGYTL
jgi:outer membrane receptor protein involved in Fe transport